MKMKMIFATGNANKVIEVRELIKSSKDLDIIGLAELGYFEDIPETGKTLTENAIIKAQTIYDKFGVSVFAEDTGLEVEALDGAPGIHSARYAGEDKKSQDNIKLLLENLKSAKSRRAQFRTVIAYRTHNEVQTFEGVVSGQILKTPEGQGGFGYDPVFRPDGLAHSFGMLPLWIKSRISHRAKAWRKFIRTL